MATTIAAAAATVAAALLQAVNFAMPDWVKHGREANERYRLTSRVSVLSYDRMAFMLAMYLPDHSLAACRSVLEEVRCAPQLQLEVSALFMVLVEIETRASRVSVVCYICCAGHAPARSPPAAACWRKSGAARCFSLTRSDTMQVAVLAPLRNAIWLTEMRACGLPDKVVLSR
jgi:hypothetical protein